MTLRRHLLTLGMMATLLWVPLGAQAQAPTAPLTSANLTRLRVRAMAVPSADTFPADLAILLGLGGGKITGKQLASPWRGGQTFLAFLDDPGGHIVVTVKDATRIAVYLTDATRELQATALIDAAGQRRIPNVQAAAAFQLTLQRWNELAADVAAATP
jgi:hypothetical protein